jgi:cell division protein FtsI/penicillin-binding protein 2
MIEQNRKLRMAFVALLVFSILGGLGARLAFLHLGTHEDYEDRVARMRHTERTIPAERGRITDRLGNTLALDLAVKDVWVDPLVVQENGHVPFMANQLGRILQVPPAQILDRMSRERRRFEYLQRNVELDVADQIQRLSFRGIYMDDAMTRHYTQSALMAHVVGFANHEGVGSAGVEQFYHNKLRGIPGLQVSERDGRRREMYGRRRIDLPPRRGNDIQLTLDQNLQYIMEEALRHGIEEYQAKAAWAIMMKVQTGEILAMASIPTFNLNEFRQSSEEERRNRAISFNYEPGSTFKAAVIAAAFNEGLVRPEDIIDCENGIWQHRGRPLRDYSPNGRISVAEVLKKSSNIGTAKIALMMPEAQLESYVRQFGIGRLTGIDLPGEESGIFHPRNRWSAISISRIAMGHEVAVTALQLLNSVNAIANQGQLMKPHVVRSIADTNGRLLYRAEPEVLSQPIRPEVARLMCDLLARVTETGGTGTRATVEGYRVAGKTGTAQKVRPDGRGYSDRLNVASFVGFMPAENPVFSMIVVVDEPRNPRTGGAVAAPLFRRIAQPAARYLEIPYSPTTPSASR